MKLPVSINNNYNNNSNNNIQLNDLEEALTPYFSVVSKQVIIIIIIINIINY